MLAPAGNPSSDEVMECNVSEMESLRVDGHSILTRDFIIPKFNILSIFWIEFLRDIFYHDYNINVGEDSMANKVSKTIQKKQKMQERIEKMEEEVKELERKASEEIGKHVLKTWNVQDDSDKVFDVIESLKKDADNLLEQDDLGKSESDETQETY